MRAARKALDLWFDRPLLDFPVAGLLAWLATVLNPSVLASGPNLGLFYQSLAALSAGLLAVGTIVVTLTLTVTPNDRLRWLLDQVGQGLRRLIVRSLGGLVLSTIGFTCLLLLGEHANRNVRIGLTVGLLAVMSLRFVRLWRILDRLLGTLMRSSTRSTEGASEPVVWSRPSMAEQDYHVGRRTAASQTTPEP